MSFNAYKQVLIKEGTHKSNGKTICRKFSSVADFCKIPAMTKPNHKNLLRQLAQGESSGFYGVEGGADKVLDLVTNGWPEGVKRMTDAFSQLSTSNHATSIRRVRTRGDHGDEFDIHRAYVGGHDKAWSRCTRAKRQAPRCVSLVVNTSASASVKAEEMFWFGAAALCLVDLLSKAGYSVEVIASTSSDNTQAEGPNTKWFSSVPLKSASDPVNLNSLASGLCLAGFFRVLGFVQRLGEDYTIYSGIGKSIPADISMIDAPANSIVIEHGDIKNEATAQAFITRTLAEIESGAIAI